MKHKIYIVATNDRDLKRRIRKIPGVPIVVSSPPSRYTQEKALTNFVECSERKICCRKTARCTREVDDEAEAGKNCRS